MTERTAAYDVRHVRTILHCSRALCGFDNIDANDTSVQHAVAMMRRADAGDFDAADYVAALCQPCVRVLG